MSSFESEGEDFETTFEASEQETEWDLHEFSKSKIGTGGSEDGEDAENAEEEDEEEEEEDPLYDCCKCPQQNRFLISFQNTSRLGDVGLDESRIKCKAFWTFIDSNPGLQKLIKEGRKPPVAPTPIPRFEACEGVCTTSGFPGKNNACLNLRQEARSSRALPIEVKYRVDEERRRFYDRQAAIIALQLKCGQPIITAMREPPPPNYRNVYADEVPEIQVIPP